MDSIQKTPVSLVEEVFDELKIDYKSSDFTKEKAIEKI